MENHAPTGVLKNRIHSLVSKVFTKDLKEAIHFAEEKYEGKSRINGEPMINHVIEIAITLLEKGLDLNTAIASLLHELPLNDENKKLISEKFTDDVVNILEGIDKIKLGTDSTDTNPEIITKYILNINKDLRPLYLKIFDTLHDIRAFDEIPDEQKKDKLKKALNIYGVLAEYLYLEDTKTELEESAFKYYLPIEYESIAKKMEELEIDEKLLNSFIELIQQSTKDLTYKPLIQYRIKNKYSIYKKLKKYEKEWVNPNINRLDDLIAFRILTKDEDSCYLVLEKLMDRGEINEERFDDYITNPKPNGYKAVQFPIKFPQISNMYIEVQILTDEMYQENTFGKASHVAYKASQSRYAKPTNKYDWVKTIQDQINISKKESRKKKNVPILCTIFEDEVFAFTPKGKIIQLDNGDTVLDFAYRLHTSIGDGAESAKINGTPAKLGEVIKTGDIVEIKVDKNKTYQKDTTLEYANSTSTRSKIRRNLTKALKK